MKFQIWCTMHNCEVVADRGPRLTVKVEGASLEINDSNLFCTGDDGEHEFELRTKPNRVQELALRELVATYDEVLQDKALADGEREAFARDRDTALEMLR